MKTETELMEFMRDPKFARRLFAEVEESAANPWFEAAHLFDIGSDITLSDYAAAIEDSPAQQSVFLTLRLAYLFEAVARKVLVAAGFDAKNKTHIVNAEKNDFCVNVLDAGGNPITVYFEMKTTQAAKWTGATHSIASGKVKNYALIQYMLNKDIPIPTTGDSFRGIFKEGHVAVISDSEIQWSGKPSTNSSFTSGGIPVAAFESYGAAISLGGVKRNKVWCKTIKEDLQQYRNRATGVIQ